MFFELHQYCRGASVRVEEFKTYKYKYNNKELQGELGTPTSTLKFIDLIDG